MGFEMFDKIHPAFVLDTLQLKFGMVRGGGVMPSIGLESQLGQDEREGESNTPQG